MNKKQLIVLWIGIVAILIPVLPSIFSAIGAVAQLLLWSFIVILVCGGLICTFKDKDETAGEE